MREWRERGGREKREIEREGGRGGEIVRVRESVCVRACV